MHSRLKLGAIIVFIILQLSACVSVNLREPIHQKRIGILLQANLKPTLCFEYYGATIFNNYVVNPEFSPEMPNHLIGVTKKAIEQSGNVAVVITLDEQKIVGDYLHFSDWDNTPSLTEVGKGEVKKIGLDSNVDHVFVFSAKNDSCIAYLSNQYSMNKFREGSLGFYLRTPLFDAQTGELTGLPFGYRGEKSEVNMPASKKLSKSEMDYYMNNLLVRKERELNQFFMRAR